MNTQNKLLPVALVAALLGGSVGAFVMRPSSKTADATVANPAPASLVAPAHNLTPANGTTETASNELSDENEAFRDGFTEGVRTAREEGVASRNLTQGQAATTTRVVTRQAPRARNARANTSRQVYYDYNQQPQKRSFWQKHRDKLTVAAGAGGGALVGGLIGGKKGAAIGALAGGGGGALYTYKIRKRNKRY